MFLRSLLVVSVVSLAMLSVSPALAMGDKTKAGEPPATAVAQKKAATKKRVAASTRAYAAAMATMHKNMNQPLSGDVDVDFVRQMIPHHEGAVAMAKIQQQYGKNEKLKRFNDWVITAQTQEIAFMKNWLHRHDNGAAPKGAPDHYGEAMMHMHHGMMQPYTGDADKDYLRGMIAHHQGAADMAAIVLREGMDPEINALADGIFRAQTQEIAWMQRWLGEAEDCGCGHH